MNKANHIAIHAYSEKLTLKLINDFFNKKEHIKGVEIMEFSSFKQINRFVVKQLFLKWKEEVNQLKSPYFDYNNEEVQKALKLFMDSLSNHILIHKDHFKPLLNKAVQDTLLLVLDPYFFFKSNYSSNDKEVINADLRYFEFNKIIAEILVKTDYSDAWLQEIIETNQAGLINPSAYVQKLSMHLHANLDDFLIEDKDQNIKTEAPMVSIKTSSVNTDAKATSTSKDIFKIVGLDKNTFFHEGGITTKKVEQLRNAISLNQRFVFQNQLFGGDQTTYEKVLSDLDQLSNFEEAQTFLIDNFVDKYHWKEKTDEVEELLHVLIRRY